MKLSEHFEWNEFHTDDWNAEVDEVIHDDIVELCENIRSAWNEPVIITSGVRTKAANDTLVTQGKASPNSSHLKGLACDIYCTRSYLRWRAVNTLIANGVTRIGIAKNFIHFDIDKDKVQNVIWTY
jgi:Peptidase M15.